jgi:hypothetical protein
MPVYRTQQPVQQSKGLLHEDIIDTDNSLKLLPRRDPFHPHRAVVVGHGPAGIEFQVVDDLGERVVVEHVADVTAARARLDQVLANPPRYGLLTHNCQHVANYVASGRWESPQLQAAVAVACVALLGFLILSDN